ncbi:response regulator transcription factor [Neptunicella marina]|uniref:Response regulator transcription factor n=1 Tax=Neptunicella marina TaxID=2125989 RepID=A0A8J6J0D0_9ALTE|nr:response regulator transcription factor [Neptunicella marina]MBC3767563.1 response regulator transcription factor [Neptunicella marina]
MTQAAHLFLVEDDLQLAELITDFLCRFGFNITHLSDGTHAAQRIIDAQPDLVILDIMLPGMNGMDICRAIRPEYTGPVLMQTALDDDIDQMMGLEIGADDYVVKQIQPRLLLSRINALLRRFERRQQPAPQETTAIDLDIGPLKIRVATRTVLLHQQNIDLTTAEYDLLYLLAQSCGKIVSRDTISHQLKGYEYDGMERSIDRRISRLRRKLGDDPNQPGIIKTIRGTGYQLCLSHPESADV